MRRAVLLAALLLPVLAHAQAAVQACRSFALQEAKRDGMSVEDIVLERDGALAMERYARKAGNQHVASVLTGNGAVVLPGAPSAELSFVCLLADDKRPVFFNWLPRQNISALAQCRRSAELRPKAGSCLELLLRTAEMDLTQVYAEGFQQANERGEPALGLFRKSNDEWRAYRDAECERRSAHPPAGVSGAEADLACRVELTRRRVLDMR